MKPFFGINIFKFFDADPESGFQDKHPGPATMLVSMRISIQLFIPMQIRIWIQGDKTIRIHADPDSGQTLKSQKVEFLHEKYT
jgi:hypothetical protein